jgi:F-type H+-transporting ATPase subunit delta
MEVEVRAAKDLTKGQVNKLQKMLEKITSKKVNVSSNKQQNLIGGMLVKIEDTVIDGTIKHKLEQLEEKLLDSTIELN